MSDLSPPLFNAVRATILISNELDADLAAELQQKLEANGGTYIPLLPDGRIDVDSSLSHIISTHVDFPEYPRTLEQDWPVVRPSWIDQSILKCRQAQPRQHSPDPALIFKELVVTCADLPAGDAEAIIAGVIALGGMHSDPLTKLCTHVVTLTEDHPKVTAAKDHKLNCKIVLPHWFDNCLKLGKKINEAPYLLPEPDILNTSLRAQPTRPSVNPDIEGAISATPTGRPPQPTPPPSTPSTTPSSLRKKLNIFTARAIYFSQDLDINARLASTHAEIVRNAGGSVVGSVAACDTCICAYRDGSDYLTASRANKQVANLAWFYNVIARNRWTNPLTKLLHYPIPRHGFPGFKGAKISLSNYSGGARTYLENLATAAGAEFTKTMKQDNTHLITAHKMSEKCDAAQEWNINIVNHIWLEESYAKCELQALTQQRYTHFPSKSNLGEVVGMTPIDIDTVKELYFADTDGYLADPTQLPDESDVNNPSPDPSSSDSDQANRDTPVPTTARAKATTATPAALSKSLLGPALDQNTPSTGRSSKHKAMQQIHKATDDMALFQKEMKRKGGVTHGGRKRSRDEALDDNARSVNGSINGAGEANSEAGPRAAKKVRHNGSDLPSVRYKMLVSGDERWVGKTKRETEDKKILRRLGIQLVTDPANSNLLCAPRILRTKKFLVALANAPDVVSTEFLDAALHADVIPDPQSYPLIDHDNERKMNITLSDSLARARINNRRLLRGWTIYVTHNIAAGYETFRAMIEVNGGQAVVYKGRTGVQLPRARLRRDEDPDAGAESQHQGGDVECDYVYLVSGSEDDESKLWGTFQALAKKQGLQARIVKTEWLLNLALKQEVEWNEGWKAV